MIGKIKFTLESNIEKLSIKIKIKFTFNVDIIIRYDLKFPGQKLCL